VSAGEQSAEVLVVRRVLPVPRERVFAAWLDPAGMAQWMCPGDVTTALVELDPRVGGAFRIVMRHGGRDDEHTGVYLAIEPPSRLSFTWQSVNTDHRPTEVTVELLERGTDTELTLTHRRLPESRVDAHRRGWTAIVEKLGATLARP
jgi:uncharacterized protein YndB with AHSA1/START domain